MAERFADTVRFYQLLDRLADRVGGPRLLRTCRGGMGWPPRGAYFFYENSESRSGTGVEPRVVRIGTHGLKNGSHAEGFRVSVEGTDDLLDALLRERSTSLVYASIERSRDNANQVAPLELIQALNIACATIDGSKPSIEDPAGAHELISDHLTQMAAASGVVENLWFRKGPLSDEEVYQRFVRE